MTTRGSYVSFFFSISLPLDSILQLHSLAFEFRPKFDQHLNLYLFIDISLVNVCGPRHRSTSAFSQLTCHRKLAGTLVLARLPRLRLLSIQVGRILLFSLATPCWMTILFDLRVSLRRLVLSFWSLGWFPMIWRFILCSGSLLRRRLRRMLFLSLHATESLPGRWSSPGCLAFGFSAFKWAGFSNSPWRRFAG